MFIPDRSALVTDVNREHQLLLCCSRTRLDPQTAMRAAALIQDGPDWEYLLRAAIRHGLMPLLYRHLVTVCPEAVPKRILRQLEECFRCNATRNLFLTRELLKLIDVFATYGIPAIPLKGPVLATAVYGDAGLRQYGDLDILVRKQDVSKARELLVSQGYRTHFHLTKAQQAAYFRLEFEQLFERADTETFVEIHWDLVPRSFAVGFDLDNLWARATRVPLGHHFVPNLSPEDLILYLCVHGSKHCWERLGWICDVAQSLFTYTEINSSFMIEQAAARGCERMLLLGLFLANDLLGMAPPHKVWSRMESDPNVELLGMQVRNWLFRKFYDGLSIASQFLFHLKVRERWKDKVQYFIRRGVMPSASDHMLLPLPKTFQGLYYVLRPVRLGARYVAQLLGRLYPARSVT